jgi:hypothetical protein
MSKEEEHFPSMFSIRYIIFSGSLLRNTSRRLPQLDHDSIWNWIQSYKPEKMFQMRCKLCEFVIDETQSGK